MAATFHTAPHSNTGSFGQSLNSLRTRLAERFARYQAYRTTVNELAMLTDRELADMGLHRSDIRDLAFEAAYKAWALDVRFTPEEFDEVDRLSSCFEVQGERYPEEMMRRSGLWAARHPTVQKS